MKKEQKLRLCESIINNYCFEEGKVECLLSYTDIYSSTNVGLSMEYLGRTEDWEKSDFEYLKRRSGSIKICFGDYGYYSLTLRELLED